ncbi:MAG: BON domain-containing protein [Gammaproteobacteria bacterium]|nr:BON domain-containing protein [Gammaproteobacteria bacterium]
MKLHKITGIMLITLFLSGCIPAAALVVGATVGGAVVYDKRSVSTITQDQQSENLAGEILRMSPDLQTNTHIVCATFNHVLLVVGQVGTEDQRATAARLLTSVKNISRVYNEITVQPVSSSWRHGHDAWITTKVKTEMLAKPGLHSTQIKVLTENGTVYLMGILSERQAEMAVNIARQIDGVKKVVKVFENPK